MHISSEIQLSSLWDDLDGMSIEFIEEIIEHHKGCIDELRNEDKPNYYAIDLYGDVVRICKDKIEQLGRK